MAGAVMETTCGCYWAVCMGSTAAELAAIDLLRILNIVTIVQ